MTDRRLTPGPDDSSIEVVCEVDAADHAQWTTDQVIAENNRTFGQDDWKRFGLRAVGQAERTIGGIAGYSHWALGHIDHIWVHPEHRGLGLGSALVAAAIELLDERGCRLVSLETYSFQDAIGFYHRHGFSVVLTTTDHPPGHRRWTMHRRVP